MSDDEIVSYCDDCDLTFVGLHVTWFADTILGISECPECGEELVVWPEMEPLGRVWK